MEQSHKIKQNLLAAITIVFWSLAYPLTKVLGGAFDSYSIATIRAIVTALVMIILAKFLHIRKPFTWKHIGYFALEGAFAFSFYLLFFNKGMETLTSATSSLIFSVAPILTAVGAWKVFGEKLKPLGWTCLSTAFAGVSILLLWGGTLNIGIGALWTFAAVIFFATYNLINRRLENLGYESMEIITYSVCCGAIETLPFLPNSIVQLQAASSTAIIGVVVLALTGTAISYYTWSKAIEYADKLTEVTNYMFISPFVTAILGWIMLGEIPSVGTYIGGTIIMISVIIFSLKGK